MKAHVSFDGGARPTNPGHAGFACIVNVAGKDHVISRYIGWKTNNQAEYYGCIVGIKYAFELGADEIEIYTDSKLVKNQIEGKWRCKSDDLKLLVRDAQEALTQFIDWEIHWHKRDNNGNADAFCTAAINWGRNQNPFTPQPIKEKRSPAAQVDPFQSTRSRLRRPSAAGKVRDRDLSSLLSLLNM